MVRFEIYPKLPLFMGKFSFFRIFYGKKLYGKLFSVPVNCSLTSYIISPKLKDFFNSTMKVELYFQLFPLMYTLHLKP